MVTRRPSPGHAGHLNRVSPWCDGVAGVGPRHRSVDHHDKGAIVPDYSREDLGEVLWAAHLWVRAIWHDRDTPAALVLTHPAMLQRWPAADIGVWLRDQIPWLGDPDVAFVEPRRLGSDLDAVDVEVDGELCARIVVARRLQLGGDGPESPLIFTVVPFKQPPRR
jgi:hypothetical protein